MDLIRDQLNSNRASISPGERCAVFHPAGVRLTGRQLITPPFLVIIPCGPGTNPARISQPLAANQVFVRSMQGQQLPIYDLHQDTARHVDVQSLLVIYDPFLVQNYNIRPIPVTQL